MQWKSEGKDGNGVFLAMLLLFLDLPLGAIVGPSRLL